jgi:hypothetical protein
VPFGKHAGKPFEDVPANYLHWILRECNNVHRWVHLAAQAELERRGYDTGPAPAAAAAGGPTAAAPGLATLEPIVSQWYRELALRFYPDRGGSSMEMLVVNVAHDRLTTLLRDMARP